MSDNIVYFCFDDMLLDFLSDKKIKALDKDAEILYLPDLPGIFNDVDEEFKIGYGVINPDGTKERKEYPLSLEDINTIWEKILCIVNKNEGRE